MMQKIQDYAEALFAGFDKTAQRGRKVGTQAGAPYFTGGIGPVRAWLITILGVVATVLGIVVVVIDPEVRSAAASIIVIFALVAVFGITLLVLQHLNRHR